ncbi:hypothetical protein NNC19_05985 [Clostridium sp. SHJSY1]|uniref:hypothetical protein n=1 Tax=Clostridium sp. SHJSY1 TaxID=2942483 RepID=UPI002875FB25|nr:hypothetical protein [Clostridium sp. SHJSY1]MDS0525225.1 hypothetical protein [Clostridium sp. SHJSY1]
MEEINLQGLNGEEVWEKLYNKELTTKKNVLEYIDLLKVLKKKEETDYDQMQSVYDFVFEKINEMKASIKPNTAMFLKNELKKQIGKYVFEKDLNEGNHFLDFFHEAYPIKMRRKDFTWVLMDLERISNEQILTTLKYINFSLLKGTKLTEEEKKDIIKEVERLVSRKRVKDINDVRSLETLNRELGIKITTKKDIFKVEHL